MPKYRHATPGSIVSSKRVIVSDALVQDTETITEITQPANSIIDGVFFRVIETMTIGSGDNIGIEVGTSSSGAQVVATIADGILDGGTSVPAGTIYSLTVLPAAGYEITGEESPDASVNTDERTIYCTMIAPNQTVSAAGKIEWNIAFRLLD
tara:strand:+ start:62 stop:517 length:456 start_codon:yes stop_codon:yes gene_type:complete